MENRMINCRKPLKIHQNLLVYNNGYFEAQIFDLAIRELTPMASLSHGNHRPVEKFKSAQVVY